MADTKQKEIKKDTAIANKLLSKAGNDYLSDFGQLRAIVQNCQGIPNLIGLHGGLPPDECYPITSISLQLQNTDHSPTPNSNTNNQPVITIPLSQTLAAQKMVANVYGHPPLLQEIQSLMHSLHPSTSTIISTTTTPGSTYTLEILMRMFLDPGDAILTEEFTYSHAMEGLMINAVPRRTIIPVPMDHHGLIPQALEQCILEAKKKQGVKVKLLYIVPTGQNPTGTTLDWGRKREIYNVCVENDVIIIEDDPYIWLQFSSSSSSGSSGEVMGLEGLIDKSSCSNKSFLELDCMMMKMAKGNGNGKGGGRVVRLDSFSKLLGPGLRVGWASSTSPIIIEKLTIAIQNELIGVSAPAQVMVGAVLKSWGRQGLDAHLRSIQGVYARKAKSIAAACKKELKGLAEWKVPSAGMFLWLDLKPSGIEDVGIDATTTTTSEDNSSPSPSSSSVLTLLQERGVIVVPGKVFHPHGRREGFKCSFIRVSFAGPSEEQLEEGVVRLAAALKEYQKHEW